ncbi:GntR family transcriptional regulator [Achromobacter denitrificans]|nr:GntR family transcriptional regulator [Achromobacter denitrificans]MDF3849941.1 GntR family transcriptional regulator [Achromobacter denitrificans]MDF3941458.1 GntR family transcriptional regulator [Achromobacter denitrificans]
MGRFPTRSCDTANASRSTVRRAVQNLAERGLVTVLRGKGTYVAVVPPPV